MSAKLSPYLNFKGTAREALEFYATVLGGTLEIATFSTFGYGDGPDADLVMHGVLTTEAGISLYAADDNRADSPRIDGPVDPGWVTLALMGDDDALLRGIWDGLAEGGSVVVPLEIAPWGDAFGEVNDRYGVKWLINISPPAVA
jgi:PhnB protein